MSLTLLAILGDIDDPRATTILCEHIKDEEWLSRWNAVGSLGRLARPSATSGLGYQRASPGTDKKHSQMDLTSACLSSVLA